MGICICVSGVNLLISVLEQFTELQAITSTMWQLSEVDHVHEKIIELKRRACQPYCSYILHAFCYLAFVIIGIAFVHVSCKFYMAFVCEEHVWSVPWSLNFTKGCVDTAKVFQEFTSN